MKIYPSLSIVTEISKLYIGCRIRVRKMGMRDYAPEFRKFEEQYVIVSSFYTDIEEGETFINTIEFDLINGYISENGDGYFIRRFELE